MNKLLTKIVGAALGTAMAVGVGVAVASSNQGFEVAHAAATEVATGDLTSTASYTGGTGTQSASKKTGYYQDNSSGTTYFQVLNNSAWWTTTPSSISFTANLAGGSARDPLTNNVVVQLLGSGGSSLGSATTVTTKVTASSAPYTVSIPVQNNVYGVKMSHVKESSFNVRFYSFSLSYEAGSAGKTETSTTVTAAGSKTTLDVTANPADTVQLTATAKAGNTTVTSTASNFTWASSQTNIATVNSSGLVTAVARGTTRITADYKGDSTYDVSSGYIDIKVVNPGETVFNFADLALENSWESGTAYTPVVVDGVTLSTSSGGNNAKYYSSDSSWRMYNGGSLSITAPSGKYLSSISSTPSYTFNIAGGATSASASFTSTVQFTEIVVVLTNTAPEIVYTVSYDANLVDYTGAVPSSTTQTSQGAAITVATALSCEGYTFGGWNTQANGEGTDVTPGATNYVPSSNHTLYGKWTENQSSGDSFTFDFTSNPGDWPTVNSAELTDYTYTLNAVDYTFSLSNVKCNTGYLMCTAPAVVGLPAISGRKLTKVVAHNSNSCSTTTKVGISSESDDESYISGGAIQTWSTTGSSYTYNLSNTDENTQYYLYVTNKNAQILSLKLTYEEAEGKTIVSSRMVSGTVSASTGDTSWTLSNFKFFVTYEGESEVEVTDKTTFNVTELVPTINADGNTNVTVTPSFRGVAYTSNAATVSASLIYVNLYSIERLYTLGADLGKSQTYGAVEFDGIYMGYVSGRGVFVMNGEYGMLVFGATDDGYTAGETYLTISGTLCTYNWLYEIESGATVSSLTDPTRKSKVQAPTTYVVTGSEDETTRSVSNRLTSLHGTVAGIKAGNNARVNTAGTKATAGSNNTIYVNVGGNEVMLYATSAAISGFENKIEVGKPITAEGFSIYYNSNDQAIFEVLFKTLIDADTNYHAADFARDLLKLTMGTCNSSYDGVTNNHEALASIWTTLAGADYWLKVEANSEEDDFILATANSAIVVPETTAGIDEMSDADAIAAAAYRYDYCTAKYSLANFATRTLSVSFSSRTSVISANETSNVAIIITIVSVISLTALGGFFLLRKKKEQ